MAGAPFITFEGIDGSGKSSAMAHVAASLLGDHPDMVATREETDGQTGEWVRQSISDRLPPLTTTFLFLADRASHVAQIKAWIADGRPVLCDRFHHSTYAYQGVTLASSVADPVAWLKRLHEPFALEPDHVLLFAADPATCIARAEARGATTPYEKVAFLEKVHAGYLALAAAEPERFHVIDANQPMADVHHEAAALVRDLLGAGSN